MLLSCTFPVLGGGGAEWGPLGGIKPQSWGFAPSGPPRTCRSAPTT